MMAKVGRILESAPIAGRDNKILLLTYWQLYDGIKIPAAVAREIVKKGASPESVIRNKRFYFTSAKNTSKRGEKIVSHADAKPVVGQDMADAEDGVQQSVPQGCCDTYRCHAARDRSSEFQAPGSR